MEKPKIEPVSRTGTPRTGRPVTARPDRVPPARDGVTATGRRWGDLENWPVGLRLAGRALLWLSPLVLLSALAFVVVYVRLQQGPISLKVMTGPIERGITAQLNGLTAKVGDTLLQLGDDGDLEFRLVNLRLYEADGSVVASAPVAAVWIDLGNLLLLDVQPRRVALIEPRVSVVYSKRDGLALSFAEPETTQTPSAGAGLQQEPNTEAMPAGTEQLEGGPASAIQRLDLA
ncbi:MAG: hypothetical protein ACM3L9_02645, partial [Deltaproteobacteria bacterium]